MALNINDLPINDRGEVWSGGQMVGMMPGMGGGVSRDQIAQSMLAQQGMPPPQGPRIDFGGLNPQGGGPRAEDGPGSGYGAFYPPAGGGGRQQVGGGWSTEGNNVYDPSGSLVGSQGLQQYGYIPGVSPQGARAGLGLDNPYTGGSSLSGGATPASVFGRSGDDTSQASRTAQDNDAEALASMALGRESFSDRSVTAPGWGSGGFAPDFGRSTPNADIAITGPPGGPFGGRGGVGREGAGSFAWGGSTIVDPTDPDQVGINTPGWGAPNNQSKGTWDPTTGQPTNQAAQQAGPNTNAPGNVGQAGTTGTGFGFGSPGWSGDFGGFSPGGGGWGGYGDFGGFSGSGFNSSGSYSGGYDTAAGNVGY